MLLIPHTAFLEPSLTGSTASVLHSGHPAVSTPPHCGMRTRRCQPAKSTFAHRTQWSTIRYLSVCLHNATRCKPPKYHGYSPDSTTSSCFFICSETFIIRTYINRLVTDGRLNPPLTFLASLHYGGLSLMLTMLIVLMSV